MPKCFYVVRATVSDPARRAAFDAWYHTEHLPQAMAAFGAEKGWRFWSETDHRYTRQPTNSPTGLRSIALSIPRP